MSNDTAKTNETAENNGLSGAQSSVSDAEQKRRQDIREALERAGSAENVKRLRDKQQRWKR